MGNKIQYLLICVLATLAISACTPSEPIKVPKIGEAVPNISWTTISGEKIDLNQFKGSWVLLCYWCPCVAHREDILTIRNVYDALYDKNLKVVVIEDNTISSPPKTLEGFANENNLPFYIVEDSQESNKKLPSAARGRPEYFLIATNGNLQDTKSSSFNNRELPLGIVSQDDIIYLDNQDYTTINVITFLQDLIRVKIDNVSINNITPDGATIRWKTDKAVRCTIGPNYGGMCPIEVQPYVYHELPLGNCPPNKTITFTIVAFGVLDFDKLINGPQISNYVNINTRSDKYSFTTLSDNSTTPHISNAKISKITDKSVEVYWETDVEANGTAKLSISSDKEHVVTDIAEDQNFTKKHSFKIDNLKPDQLYWVDFKSEDVDRRFDTYKLWFFTPTLNYKTYGAEIFNIKVSDLTDKSVKISWSTDRAVSSWASFNYGLTYIRDEPKRDHSLTTNLKPDTEYLVQLRTADGGVSDVFNFKTLKEIDSTPNIP